MDSLITQKKFKSELKKILLLGSFYSIEEFYEWASKKKKITMLHIFNTYLPVIFNVFYYKVPTPGIISIEYKDIMHTQTCYYK